MISETLQLKKILAHDGNLLITGGPGSGKTTSSILKVKTMAPSLGDYQKILFLSFSNGAIFQIREAARKLLTKDELKKLNIQTYHSFCFSLIRSYGLAFGVKKSPQIFPPEEQVIIPKKIQIDDLEEYLRSQCFQEGKIAFDHMPGLVSRLLEEDQVCRVIQSRYPIIIVDEFQDSNDAEWAMLKKFGSGIKIITLADPQQRIYEFRGAKQERIEEFEDFFKPERIDLQSQNHRSPNAGILEFADSVKDGKNLAINGNIKFITYTAPAQTGFYLKTIILDLRKELKGILGDNPRIAILTGKNDSALFVSSELNKQTGKLAFPIKHDLILDADGMFLAQRFMSKILENAAGLEAVISNAMQELGNFYLLSDSKKAKELSDHLFGYANEYGAGRTPKLRKFVEEMPKIITQIRSQLTGDAIGDWEEALSRIIPWAKDNCSEIHPYLFGKNPFRHHRLTNKLDEDFEDAIGYKSISSVLSKIHLTNRVLGGSYSNSKVVVMTMHKSKGKEYDAIILFDHPKAHSLILPGQNEVQNRILIRVAITRARHRVTFLHKKDEPPQFLIKNSVISSVPVSTSQITL